MYYYHNSYVVHELILKQLFTDLHSSSVRILRARSKKIQGNIVTLDLAAFKMDLSYCAGRTNVRSSIISCIANRTPSRPLPESFTPP